MSFLDTTLTPASGYTYVNYKQIYDAVAAQMTAHASWSYVESVDYVLGANTTRTFVWKCSAAGSGLPNDFYVLFTLQFTTAGTVYQTTPGICLQISICELYNSSTKVASKFATQMTSTNFTMGADRSHPLTWTLTAARPSSPAYPAYAYLGPIGSVTSHRVLIGVFADSLVLGSNNATPTQVYVGAFETLLSTSDDPMPIGIGSNATNYSSFSASGATYHYFSSTRHPLMTPGSTYNYAFGHSFFYAHTTQGNTFGGGPYATTAGSTSGGVVGDPSNNAYSLYQSGVVVSKCCLTTSGNQTTGASRGGFRGFLKNLLAGQFTAHSFGDTFLIDGKTYVGFGNSSYGVLDTTA